MARENETPEQQKARLRNEAERTLRHRHREELNGLIKAAFEREGIEYRPRLSEEEKAAKAIEDLLAAHPELRERYAPVDNTAKQDAGTDEPATDAASVAA
jgi:GrpB-like predicted nucleotidyltransferase (UPF0157 family)